MKQFKIDKLNIEIFDNRKEMGESAAKDISDKIAQLLTEKQTISIIFAAAPSQNEVLSALVKDKNIDWKRINAFHMDEYIGIGKDAPQCFGGFLKNHIFSLVPFKSVNYLDGNAKDIDKEIERYTKLLQDNSPDIVIMGIGENGHIAFNDPPVADFHDKKAIKVVTLDEICRNQQVNDGCFSLIEDVPKYALTLTIPTLFMVPFIFCVVPSKTKARAVKETLFGNIDEHCPASVLRKHDNAKLYLDNESAELL